MKSSCILWKPETKSSSPITTQNSFLQLSEFIVVTTAQPISDWLKLENIIASPPTHDMIENMLRMCGLTADHFKLSVPILGTFAVWGLSQEGNNYFVIPRGYEGPEGNFSISQGSENHCLNLVASLAQMILKRSIPLDDILCCTMITTHGDFTIYTIGISIRCDVCGRPIEKNSGFTLSAKQIVSTPHYWRIRYENNKALWDEKGIRSFDQYRSNEVVRTSEINIILNSGSDWLVCNECIEHFNVDYGKARQFADAWWRNKTIRGPYDWAATLSDINMG